MELEPQELDALASVLNYMYDDEYRDYMEQDEEGRKGHILNDLRVLEQIIERG